MQASKKPLVKKLSTPGSTTRMAENTGKPRLMTLPQAAVYLFGDKKRVASLRTEIKNGRLDCIEIAKTFYVREEDLNRMLEKCREKSSPQGSNYEKKKVVTTRYELSKTGQKPSGQDALKVKLNLLKSDLRSTLPKNGNPTPERQNNIVSLSATPSRSISIKN